MGRRSPQGLGAVLAGRAGEEGGLAGGVIGGIGIQLRQLVT